MDKRIRRWLRRGAAALGLLLVGPLAMLTGGQASLDGDWRAASRERAGLAPPAGTTSEAVVQVYAARSFEWRGAFAVHSWLAVKPEGAPAYTTYEVTGWHVRHGGRAVRVTHGPPDRYWFGSRPRLLADLRGPAAARIIPPLQEAVAAYPYRDRYRTWPGPNSNTFTAFVTRRVPELGVDLPPTAIGKDFLAGGGVLARAPSGGGVQLSLFGLLGIILASEEGLELNLLGLSVGIDPGDGALRLPGFGCVRLW